MAQVLGVWAILACSGAMAPAHAEFSFVPVWTNSTGIRGMEDERAAAGAGDVNRDGYADIIVGIPKHGEPIGDSGAVNPGRACVFLGSLNGPAQTPDWVVDGPLLITTNDFFGTLWVSTNAGYFGFAVDGAGDVNRDGYDDVIIGAYKVRTVFVYYGSPTGLSRVANWLYTQTDPDAHSFGYTVAGVGDLNGDGYDDIAVGDYGYSTEVGGSYSGHLGAVYVFHGSATGVSAEPNARVTGERLSYFGDAVSGAGDLNRDGYDDFVVGGWYYGEDQGLERGTGFARVYYGSENGIAPGWTELSPTPTPSYQFACFGCSVAGAGDVNDDGYADVAIGARQYNLASTSQSGAGTVFIYPGGAAGVSTTPIWEGTDRLDANRVQYGQSVAGVGDVNADGIADILVGATDTDGPQSSGLYDMGTAYVYFGPLSGQATSRGDADAWFENEISYSYLGEYVSVVGDVNGDRGDDLLVHAPNFSPSAPDTALTYLFLGVPGPPPGGALLVIR